MIWILGWYAILSTVTFILYGLDKRKARLGNWRIKESTLHGFDLIGGWPGGFVAQRYFRHKSRKTSFQVVYWSIVAIHALAWGLWIYSKV